MLYLHMTHLKGPFLIHWYIHIDYWQQILTRNHLLNVVTNPEAKFCLTIIEDGVPVSHGVLCEFLATSLLTFAVCSATDRRNAIWRDSIAIKLGITIGALVYGIVSFFPRIFWFWFYSCCAQWNHASSRWIKIWGGKWNCTPAYWE